jgi:hypothetical protein
MIFDETVIPKGARLYKGMPRGMHPRRTRNFFLTSSARTARGYGPTINTYVATKPLRLFVLSHRNVKLLLDKYRLSPAAKVMLRLALGTRTTRARQHLAYRLVLRGKGYLPGARNTRPGQRLSVGELDRQVFEKLSREFLIPEKYDGYYAPAKPSIFHGGVFHSEIMIAQPMHSIKPAFAVRATPQVQRRLGVSNAQIIKRLPGLFVEYSKTQRRLLRPYGGFIPYLGGGMAVKLYLEARAIKAPPKVLQTTDFDFTFAVPKRLTTKMDVVARVIGMRKVMTTHLEGFVTWLGRSFGVRPQIVVKDFVPPVRLLPTTGKRIYQVISYGLQFPGVAKPVDFVDTTLAHVPGMSREHIHHVFSRSFGMPIERLKTMYKNVLAVLAGSFVTKDPSLKSRNPLTGNRAEKGIKNTARLATLIKANAKTTVHARGLVNAIRRNNTKNAYKKARLVIKNLSRK